MSIVMALGLGAGQAGAACQVKPEFLITDPGQTAVFELVCDNAEVFDSIRWTSQKEPAGAVTDITSSIAANVAASDQIRLAIPVDTLGTANSTYKINFVGTNGGSTIQSQKVAMLIVNSAAVATMTVGKSGAGTGTVTSGPAGINCGADCTEDYPFNTQVMLNAAPAAGSTFTGWSGECVGTGSCQVTMNGAKNVTATFGAVVNGQCGTANGTTRTSAPSASLCADSSTPAVATTASAYTWTCQGTPNLGSSASCSATRAYNVSVNVGSNGSMSPNTTQTVAYGATQPYTITPATNYSAALDAATTCGGAISANGLSYTTASVTQDCLVKVNFTNAPACGSANGVGVATAPSSGLCAVGTASPVTDGGTTFSWSCSASGQTSASCQAPKAFTVSIGTINGGTISPATAQVVTAGQTRPFTLTPTTPGYTPSIGGTCGGSAVSNGNGGYTYTTAAVNAACTVSVTFADPSSYGNCPAPASTVQVTNTQIPASTFPRTDYYTAAPETVYSYKFRTLPANVGLKSGMMTATRMTTGITAKRVVIASCPGSTTPIGPKCTNYGTDTSYVQYYVNAPAGTSTTKYCLLEPDTDYYVNVFSKINADDTTYTCGNANSPSTPSTNCAFTFTGN